MSSSLPTTDLNFIFDASADALQTHQEHSYEVYGEFSPSKILFLNKNFCVHLLIIITPKAHRGIRNFFGSISLSFVFEAFVLFALCVGAVHLNCEEEANAAAGGRIKTARKNKFRVCWSSRNFNLTVSVSFQLFLDSLRVLISSGFNSRTNFGCVMDTNMCGLKVIICTLTLCI